MKLILIRGLAATGKSTLAATIKQVVCPKIFVWEKDSVFDRLLLDGTLWDEANRKTYENLYVTILQAKSENKDMLVDAPFYRKRDINYLISFCDKQLIKFKSILSVCSDENEWRKRFTLRSIDPEPNQLITDYDTMKEHYGSMSVDPLHNELVYDSKQPPNHWTLRKFIYSD